ncbi:MAG: 50S ribosomal protein L29 [Sulfolobaceae archaeon]
MPLKAEELRKLDIQELKKKLEELRVELIRLRSEARRGTLKNTASIRNVRKDIARILTVISEKRKQVKVNNKNG